MAYEKNNWQSGDVVTSAKLNHMEDGIASGGVMVIRGTVEGSNTTLNKTWQEIYDAMHNGILCVYLKEVESISAVTFYVIVSVYQDEVVPGGPIAYSVDADSSGEIIFSATSSDGYPVRTNAN